MSEGQKKQGKRKDRYIMKEKFDTKLKSQEQLRSELFDSIKISNQILVFKEPSIPRTKCPNCQKQKKIICFDCLIIIQYKHLLPRVTVPVSLDIIFHSQEKPQKSSALPLKFLLDPEQLQIIYFPDQQIPVYDQATTIFLFPHKNSRKIREISSGELQQIKKVVAIDCTWNQTNSINAELHAMNYKFVRLEDYNTTFWRHQQHDPKCLATIEAIYYFYKEFHQQLNSGQLNYQYNHQFDNLLFFYKLNYDIIQEHYKKDQNLQFNRIQNYIKYDKSEKEPVDSQSNQQEITEKAQTLKEQEQNTTTKSSNCVQEDQQNNSNVQQISPIDEIYKSTVNESIQDSKKEQHQNSAMHHDNTSAIGKSSNLLNHSLPERIFDADTNKSRRNCEETECQEVLKKIIKHS